MAQVLSHLLHRSIPPPSLLPSPRLVPTLPFDTQHSSTQCPRAVARIKRWDRLQLPPPVTNTPPNRSQVKHFCQNLQALLQPKKLYCPQVHELTEAKSPSLEDQTLTLGTAAQLRGYPAFVPPSLQKRAASTGEIAGCLPTTLFAGLRRNHRDKRLKGLKGRVRGK